MRFFFLTYREGKAGVYKFMKLKRRDVIVFRITGEIEELCFKGACVVTDEPYRTQDNNSQVNEKLLWPEEKRENKILFPCRVEVSFKDAPRLTKLSSIRWDDLLSLKIPNKKGKIMNKQALGIFLIGNFLELKIEEFKSLSGYSEA